jgi:serine/threonine protein kinase
VLVAAPQSDRVLADRYRLVRLLGRGGMGSVWEAEHVALGTPVAIKLIRPELADGQRARERFLREARAAAGLRSPHVVQIFDYGVDAGEPYIAMERLDGESLAERLRRVGKLSAEELLTVITHVCRGIAKAHAGGVVHRDLKPDNVFLDADGVKVLDFGIAKAVPTDTMEAQTQSGALLGTPFYMSPEQARDPSNADPRSDLWSVAVIAYQCLVGRRPFDSASLPALSVQILVDPIPVPSEHGEVPAGFDAWFARATQRDPNARFQSARELAQALPGALGLDAPSEDALPMPTTTTARRRPSLWIAAVLVVLAIAVGAAWLAVPPEPTTVRSPAPPIAAPPPSAPTVEQQAPVAPPPVAVDDEPPPQRKKKPARANVDDLEL